MQENSNVIVNIFFEFEVFLFFHVPYQTLCSLLFTLGFAKQTKLEEESTSEYYSHNLQ